MAVRTFLKLDDVPGESAIVGHVGEIEILSLGWEQLRKGAGPGSTGMLPGTLTFGEIRMTAVAGKAGPNLLIRCAQGIRSKNGVITIVDGNVTLTTFVTVRLTDVLITSYLHSGVNDIPFDSFSFGFAAIEFEYQPSSGAAVKGSWKK